MNKKLISLLAGAAFMLAGCNEQKAEAAKTEVKTEAAAPAQPAPAPAVEETAKNPPKVGKVYEGKIAVVEWAEALKMAENGGIFVDVRNPPELNDGFIKGELNIPMPEIRQRIGELPKDKDLLIFCRSGRRSEVVANFLVQQGYDRVYNVLGGFLAYPHK